MWLKDHFSSPFSHTLHHRGRGRNGSETLNRFTNNGCRLICCLAAAFAGCSDRSASNHQGAVESGRGTEPDAIDPGETSEDVPDTRTSDTSADSTPKGNEDSPRSPEPVPLDAAQLHFAGMKALQAGQLDEAYNYARQAMRTNSEDPPIIFLMATVLAERHRFPEAIEMLEEVAATVPEARMPAMGQTADWLVRFGQWEKAESRYGEILRQMPDVAMVHRELAKLKLRQGRRVEASEHLDRLCHLGDVTENELRSMLMISRPFVGDAIHPSFDPVGPLGLARSDIAEGDWESARSRLQQLESPGPMESALLARAHVALNDPAALRSWVEQAEPSVNASPDGWFAKGSYADENLEPADAIRCYLESIRLDPTDQEAHTRLAAALEEAGADDEAAVVKQRAELLDKTRKIGSQMAKTQERDAQSILTVGELVRQLGRPLESLGWRGVWLTYANETSSLSPADVQKTLDALVQERAVLLQGEKTKATIEELIPGLNWSEIPSVPDVDQRLKVSASGKSE